MTTDDEILAILSGTPAETGEPGSVTVAPPAYVVAQQAQSDVEIRITAAQARLAEVDRQRDEIRAELRQLRAERDGW